LSFVEDVGIEDVGIGVSAFFVKIVSYPVDIASTHSINQ